MLKEKTINQQSDKNALSISRKPSIIYRYSIVVDN